MGVLAGLRFSNLYTDGDGEAVMADPVNGFRLVEVPRNAYSDVRDLVRLGVESEGRTEVKLDGVTYRASRITGGGRPRFSFRRQPDRVRDPEELGMPPWLVQVLRELGPLPGVLAITGPAGRGKSTTYSALGKDRVRRHGGVKISIEDPREHPLECKMVGDDGRIGWIFQVNASEETFEAEVMSALRTLPNFVGVGELRSPRVYKLTMRLAMKAIPVLTTGHASTIEDFLRDCLMQLSVGDSEEAAANSMAKALSAIVTQRFEPMDKSEVRDPSWAGAFGEVPFKVVHEILLFGPADSSIRNTVRQRNFGSLAGEARRQHARLEELYKQGHRTGLLSAIFPKAG